MKKVIDKVNILWYNLLSKRDAPSLHLDFFHTKKRAHGSFLFYKLAFNQGINNKFKIYTKYLGE